MGRDVFLPCFLTWDQTMVEVMKITVTSFRSSHDALQHSVPPALQQATADPRLCRRLQRQSCGFSSSHVWMWELDHKENWVPKNWCFWNVVLEKTLENPFDSKEIKPSILKEVSSEYSLEGLMLKLKLQYCGHLMQRTDSLEKTLMLAKTEGGRTRGQQDEMAGWHHWLNGNEFE